MNSSPIIYHQNIPIQGKHVLLIDDAIESGGTMKRVVEHITHEFQVKSLSIATLFVRANRTEIPAAQYFSYEVDNDELLVGYGLPWNDKFRNYPFVSKLVK